jgi:hypothetical protein
MKGRAVARLASGLWVAAYLRRLDLLGIPAFVTARGDDGAGAVLVKLATLDGQAQLFERGFDLASGAQVWRLRLQGAEAEVDAAVTRERGRDRDLWVIEVEDRQGRSLLDEEGLAG